jgi:ABC-type phosphonate transport system ATPase subunit
MMLMQNGRAVEFGIAEEVLDSVKRSFTLHLQGGSSGRSPTA